MAKKAAKGSGTIRKKAVTRNGKQYTYWEARVTTGRDPGTGKQVQRSFTGKTQKEVREKMQVAAVEVNQGTYAAPKRMTVGQWLDIWQHDYLESIKPRTVECYQCQIENHIKPKLGSVKLEALTTPDIQRFYNSLTEKGLSAKTVKITHGVLHKALQQAVAIGYLRFNPTDACSLPRVERKELKPLDDDSISAFLTAVKGNRHEILYLVTLFTGLRQGEVLGLTWDCIDFVCGTMLINKQLQLVKDDSGNRVYKLVSTKNGR